MRLIIKSKVLPVVFGIFLFMVLFIVLDFTGIENVNASPEWSIVDCSDTEFVNRKFNFPFYLASEEIARLRLSAKIDNGNYDSIIIPEIDAGILKVYLNGDLIGVKGDDVNLTAVLYPKSFYFPVKSGESSLIELEVGGRGDICITSSPFLALRSEYISKIQIRNFLKSDMVNSAVSIVFMMGVILIFMSFAIDEIKKAYQLIGTAMICSAVFLINRLYTESWGTVENYLFFEKIFYSASHICVYCLMKGIECILKLRIRLSKIYLIVQAAMIILLFLQSGTEEFVFFSNIGNMVNFAGLTIILLEVLLMQNTKQIFTLTFLSLILVHDIILRLNHSGYFFLNPYGQLIGVFGIAFFIVKNIKTIRIERENAIKKSLKDPLTGTFNRNILHEIDYGNSDYIILMDMDNLKRVNDNYGHDEGDRLIVEFVKVLRSHVRNDDVVVRIGGDEFLAILRNCKRKNVIRIMSRVKDEFYVNSFKNLGNFSYGMVKYSGNIMEDISRADNKMYLMKKEKPVITGS